MRRREMPSAEYLRECLTLDVETGRLFWRARPPHHFKADGYRTAEGNANNWNSLHAGTEAFTTDCHGYRISLLSGRDERIKLYAHRVIWKMVYGEEPNEIDHIDGDRSNNRPSNLRNVTRLENTQNRRLSHRNTSGCHGVTWAARERKWAVQAPTTAKGLGYFDDLNAAIAVRKAAERDAGFHPNHGRK